MYENQPFVSEVRKEKLTYFISTFFISDIGLAPDLDMVTSRVFEFLGLLFKTHITILFFLNAMSLTKKESWVVHPCS